MPICRFAAEPPHGDLPPEETLQAEFLGACLRVETEEEDGDLGAAGEIHWFPDRTWSGRTYVPATARTERGFEFFGYVSFSPTEDGPQDLYAWADYTADTADDHPEWRMDISQEVVGGWRGERDTAAMTLIWGVPFERRGRRVAAELGPDVVDETEIDGDRFTLLAPDAYDDNYLDVVLLDGAGNELVRESLYEDEDDE
jgi:hypothetical protein